MHSCISRSVHRRWRFTRCLSTHWISARDRMRPLRPLTRSQLVKGFVMLDFGALPPEISSGLMYAGAGSASMMGAASEWNTLAAELNSAAVAYDRVVNTLSSEEWLGPAWSSMEGSAAPYLEWMRTPAAAAEHAASQAMSAAAAFET